MESLLPRIPRDGVFYVDLAKTADIYTPWQPPVVLRRLLIIPLPGKLKRESSVCFRSQFCCEAVPEQAYAPQNVLGVNDRYENASTYYGTSAG